MPITVGKKYQLYRDFAHDMQSNLPLLGVQLNNRLYRLVGAAFGERHRSFTDLEEDSITELSTRPFKDWNDFTQFIYQHRLVAARTTGFVSQRPRNLGARPPWIAPVNDVRPKKQGLAIRHIVPSHLLGYAIENASGTIKDDFRKLTESYAVTYNKWQSQDPKYPALFGGMKPRMTEDLVPGSEWTARRWAWALLYNHPGNLWVGDASDNQTIGFMYATVNGVLRRMQQMLKASPTDVGSSQVSPRKGVKPKTPDDELLQAVSKALAAFEVYGQERTSLREEISDVLFGAAQVEENDVLSATDIVCFVEDVAANLQFDIPDLTDWGRVQDWRQTFMEPGISVPELCSFLKFQFKESIAATGLR